MVAADALGECQHFNIYMNRKLSFKCVCNTADGWLDIWSFQKEKMLLKFFPTKQRKSIALEIKCKIVEFLLESFLEYPVNLIWLFFWSKPTFRRRSSPLRRRPVRGRGGWQSTGRRRGDSPGVGTSAKKYLKKKIKCHFIARLFCTFIAPQQPKKVRMTTMALAVT